MAEVVCLGEALIDFVAQDTCEDVGQASGFLRAPGGAPANVAVGVARLGHSSAFLGKVGADPFGRFLARTFAEAGVDTGGMVFDPKRRTGLAFVTEPPEGMPHDYCFFRNPSADMTYATGELDRTYLAAGKIFHYGSISLIDYVPRLTTYAAIKAARAAGMLISYDPNLRPPLWPSLKQARITILRAMRFADIVKVSEAELAFLLHDSDAFPVPEMGEWQTAASHFLHTFRNIALLVVTRGAQGCGWKTRHNIVGQHAGYKVPFVNGTGAGDGFVAGLLTGLLAMDITSRTKLDSLDAIRLQALCARANAVGALTTTKEGAIPALPTAEALAHFQHQKDRSSGK